MMPPISRAMGSGRVLSSSRCTSSRLRCFAAECRTKSLACRKSARWCASAGAARPRPRQTSSNSSHRQRSSSTAPTLKPSSPAQRPIATRPHACSAMPITTKRSWTRGTRSAKPARQARVASKCGGAPVCRATERASRLGSRAAAEKTRTERRAVRLGETLEPCRWIQPPAQRAPAAKERLRPTMSARWLAGAATSRPLSTSSRRSRAKMHAPRTQRCASSRPPAEPPEKEK
mmetsp:Transcript_691/g.2200  ORF Transcript_691/g.2200 Transcript_691/m.2200 type:complete len:232 (-) Transcript_691:391-1086(-)